MELWPSNWISNTKYLYLFMYRMNREIIIMQCFSFSSSHSWWTVAAIFDKVVLIWCLLKINVNFIHLSSSGSSKHWTQSIWNILMNKCNCGVCIVGWKVPALFELRNWTENRKIECTKKYYYYNNNYYWQPITNRWELLPIIIIERETKSVCGYVCVFSPSPYLVVPLYKTKWLNAVIVD